MAKGRHRYRIISMRGRKPFVQEYTPKETQDYEDRIRYYAGRAMAQLTAIEQSCEIHVRAYIPVPTSWSGKKTRECLAGILKPPSVPDVDNYAKAALDGCNKIVYRDDSLIWKITAEKHYTEEPRLEIDVVLYVPTTLI